MIEKKFKINLISEIVRRKKANYFRLYVSMYLHDTNGQGWFTKESYIKYVCGLTGYKKKTIINKLLSMEHMGWLTTSNGRIFYKSQEKVLNTFEGVNYRGNTAVYISEADVRGTLVEWRAFLYEATISDNNDDNGKMVSRKVIKEKITGNSKITQRKYERLRGIKRTANYAIVGDESADLMELVYKYCQPIFTKIVDGKLYFIRRLPNSYKTAVKTGKRIRAKVSGAIYEQVPTDFKKLYFSSDDNATTGYVLNGDGLWIAI